MSRNVELRRYWVLQATVVAASPILGYGLAFAHEVGFFWIYGIPLEFIQLNLSIIFFAAASIIVLAYAFFMILSPVITWVRLKENPLTQEIARNIYFLVLMIGSLLIFRDLWWAWLPFVLFSLFFILLNFGWPLISQRKGNYLEKLKATQIAEGELGSIIQDFGRSSFATATAILLILVLLFHFSLSIGCSSALHKTDYLVPSTYENAVVLRIYDDKLLCAEIDRDKRKIESTFFILETSSDPVIMLKLESIGRLKPRFL